MRRKIVGSIAAFLVAEADALGFDVEKARAALKFWKNATSATAAFSNVGRLAVSKLKKTGERFRDAFGGERRNDETNERDDGGAA